MLKNQRWSIHRLALICLSLLLSFAAFQPGGAVVAQARAMATGFNYGYPGSIAATGDSITQAANSSNLGDNPANSWSTGDNSAIQSHYLRLLALNPAINGKIYNDAASGSVVSDLNGQLANAAGQKVDYVTILSGANDICNQSNMDNVTSVTNFTNQFRQALTTFSTADPDARIFVASIPDLLNLWQVLYTNPTAQQTWDTYNICPLMLASSADTSQQMAVEQILTGYNSALASVCAEFIHCRFDNNTTFNTSFIAADVSTLDYFHPSLTGQTHLAAGTWAATFGFTDTVPPVSQTNLVSDVSGNLTASLTAADNVGLSGLEYRLDGGNWTRYVGPVILTSTNISLTYRSVDVNGNNEVARTLWIVGNGAATGGTGQTLSTALAKARAGDTVGFALVGPVQVSTSVTVTAGVNVNGGSCPGPLIKYSGPGLSSFNLGTNSLLNGLRLKGFRLIAGPGGKNRLSCLSVNPAGS